MNVAILRITLWVAIVVGVALSAGLAPEPRTGGITLRVPTEGEYLLALAPIEVASVALLVLVAIGPVRSGSSFRGQRRIAFWVATLVVMAFWISFYADWRYGLLRHHLVSLLLS
jgi:hypothetical protein